MLDSFVERENEIFEVLTGFEKAGLDFVLVGGYAVAAFRHRFSVDADLVVRKRDLQKFVEIVEKRGYEKRIFKNLVAYGGEFLQYEKKTRLPVTVDFLVNALASRQTGGFWTFDYIESHSQTKRITGIEKEVSLKIPEKELLIAIKLHACRGTDVRDAVALMENAKQEKIIAHFLAAGGNPEESVFNAEKILADKDFENSFKGVFETKKFEKTSVSKLGELLRILEKTGKKRT